MMGFSRKIIWPEKKIKIVKFTKFAPISEQNKKYLNSHKKPDLFQSLDLFQNPDFFHYSDLAQNPDFFP